MIVHINIVVWGPETVFKDGSSTASQAAYYRKTYDLPFAPFVGLRFKLNELLDEHEQDLIIEEEYGIDYNLSTHEFDVYIHDQNSFENSHEVYLAAGFVDVLKDKQQ